MTTKDSGQEQKIAIMDKERIISVDYDGTVCHFAFPESGKPREEVIQTLRWLKEDDWHIIIYSARATPSAKPGAAEAFAAMTQFLIDHDVPHDEIWMNPGKPMAHVYLDDRAIRPEPGIPAMTLFARCLDMGDAVQKQWEDCLERYGG